MTPRRPGDPRAPKLARLYRERFQDDSLPVPVDAIATDLLGLWIEVKEELPVSGMLIPHRREIWVNGREARESEGRRRFTIAHEIGHWVCHCQNGTAEEILCRSVSAVSSARSDPREREANVFAADLLMPEDEVRRLHEKGSSPAEMSESFGVSELALGWRLYNFRLADRPPRTETSEVHR